MTSPSHPKMTSESASALIATASQVASPEKTAALVLPRHDKITAAELAQGNASKRTYVLARVAAGASTAEVPIAGVRPAAGELRWFLDAAACGTQST